MTQNRRSDVGGRRSEGKVPDDPSSQGFAGQVKEPRVERKKRVKPEIRSRRSAARAAPISALGHRISYAFADVRNASRQKYALSGSLGIS